MDKMKKRYKKNLNNSESDPQFESLKKEKNNINYKPKRNKNNFSKLKNIHNTTKYLELLQMQGGVCGICKTLPKNKKFDADYDHVTGKMRGLLCTNCSTGLNSLKKDPYTLKEAQKYIENNGSIEICNKCKKTLSLSKNEIDNSKLKHFTVYGEYNSSHLEDLIKYDFILCEECLCEIFSTFKIPVKKTEVIT